MIDRVKKLIVVAKNTVLISFFSSFLSSLKKTLFGQMSQILYVKKLHGGDDVQTDIATYRLNRLTSVNFCQLLRDFLL